MRAFLAFFAENANFDDFLIFFLDFFPKGLPKNGPRGFPRPHESRARIFRTIFPALCRKNSAKNPGARHWSPACDGEVVARLR